MITIPSPARSGRSVSPCWVSFCLYIHAANLRQAVIMSLGGHNNKADVSELLEPDCAHVIVVPVFAVITNVPSNVLFAEQ